MKFLKLAPAIIAIFSAGCSKDNLPDYVKLGDLRVLAMKADHPQVDPTLSPATVVITPLVSDLNQGRNLTYAAEACIDPGVGLGASPSCTGRPDRVVLAAPGTAIPSLATSTKTFTGTTPAITVVVPTQIYTGRSTTDQQSGIAYLVIYTLTTAAGDASVTSFKRVIASTQTPQNTNPSLTDVMAGTQSLLPYLTALTYAGGKPVQLTPVFGPGSVEGSEVLQTTWFLSDGDIQNFRTLGLDPNLWTPPSAKSATHATLFVAVVRDGRGGEDFKQFEF